MQSHQELVYSAGYDYQAGSPHLKHPNLYQGLLIKLRASLAEVSQRNIPDAFLEVGAGEGSFVEPVLAYGFDVTVTEMSRASIATLMERYGQNPRFHAHYDENGTLSVLGDKHFSVVLFASVLHHIPEYVAAIENAITKHLDPGGSFLSFQDPLWYPSVNRSTKVLNRAAYLSWRLGQGGYRQGLRTWSRRIRGIYDESEPSDMVEYHVVRNGVDHERLVSFLSERFDDVSLLPYWSTQSTFWQNVGERLQLKNTFALHASGYKG